MIKPTIATLALALLAGALLAACGANSPDYRGTPLDGPAAAPDLALTDQDGRPFNLAEQRGRVVLLFFGYTLCPDVCPTTLGIWRQVHAGLGAGAAQVRFVFVTVDPERDTPERLGMHVRAFNPEFVGLTGSQEQLEALYAAFGIVHEVQPVADSALGYLVSHTSSSFLIDPSGRPRLREGYGTPAGDIVHDIRLLLEPAP